MGKFVVRRLDSLAELRRNSPLWDDLWQRSETWLPTTRAELLAQWCEQFAPRNAWTAFVVEHDGRWVAALPLIKVRKFGIQTFQLPNNEWSPSGDLLLDPRDDGQAACQALIGAMRRGTTSWLTLQSAPLQTARWQTFLGAIDSLRLEAAARSRYNIGLTQIGPDWASYLQTRSRNHRRHLNKAKTRAGQQGATRLTRYRNLSVDDVETLLRSCFEVEASGWKGQAESAVLRVPGVWEFYLRQARQLAAWQQLSITTLEQQGQTIAFEYGWCAKGVYSSTKVGYDENFRHLTPGQLLRRLLIEQIHQEQDLQWFDFLGPLTPATLKWATHEYTIDRLDVSLGGVVGRAMMAAYRRLRPMAGQPIHGDRAATQFPTPVVRQSDSEEATASKLLEAGCP